MHSSSDRARATLPPARVRCITQITRAARKLSQAPPSAWLEQYFAGVDEQDLQARPALELARLARHHWQLGRQRKPGLTRIEIWNPESSDGLSDRRSYLLLITSDRPFLVDSVTLTLARHRIAVHLLIHPVLAQADPVRGQRRLKSTPLESWQLIEIDRQFDADQCRALQQDLEEVLDEVTLAVSDWNKMRDRISAVTAALSNRPLKYLPSQRREEQREALALLDWIAAGNFVLLGYQYYTLTQSRGHDELRARKGHTLGIMRTAQFPRRISAVGALGDALRDAAPIIVTKAAQRSRIHRAGHLDHIAIKDFDLQGKVCGEHRVIGLWTSRAYFSSPRDIPLLRRKIAELIRRFGLEPSSHDGKAVLATLENWPRDELFASSSEELQKFVRATVNLYDRGTTRTLLRFDALGDFWTGLVFVPRDRYNTEVRVRIENLLRDALHADQVESQPQVAAAGHARLHVTLRGAVRELSPAARAALDTRISEATFTWQDRLSTCIDAHYPASQAALLKQRHAARFSASYQSEVDADTAVDDLRALETLSGATQSAWRMVRTRSATHVRVELRIVRHGEALPIADLMPLLENFGLRLLAERPWPVLATVDRPTGWIQAFELDPVVADLLVKDHDADRLLTAMRAVQDGFYDSDALNRLVLRAKLQADEVNLLRAICRYLLQTGLPFSLNYMAETLARQALLAADLYALFTTRHDPNLDARARKREETRLVQQIEAALEQLTSADEDRILRALLAVICACLRSNFHASRHVERATLAFKLNPAQIPGLPLPKPEIETWVFGALVEGVHLRMGQVARGGLRWSDRREDFRTEILGLMKAQNVKNTVIVPVGAKGGFVVRGSAGGLTRDEWLAQGIAAYQAYIGALLDITDNVRQAKIIAPPAVLRLDGDDPYLVVAADKGTASFSDIANEISLQRGFWLGDAFASGGSVGYDHKKMGITARGAWECVRRHFRELGLDTQRDEFSVVGIGDMSGDVFGNGLLLSKQIKLVAAFNHQHIFIDPNPDAAVSFRERQRLFQLPRSGWNDYDSRCLSAGGAIHARDAKTLSLSPEARTLLQLPSTPLAPNEVIQAILRLPVDLLWNGGIGTYIKASHESHADASDRSNDAVRIDGRDLRARVVGEGGNLGLTQPARVEYARLGGRINTDFIDNSAGVNTSDLEVNIKILLAAAENGGRLQRRERNRLLATLEPEVAALALRNNYLQSQALSILQSQAISRANEFRVLVRSLEKQAGLNRKVERLPDDAELGERQKRHEGLTRPELAVVFSYAKMDLNRQLLASPLPEDPYFAQELARYFPPALQRKFGKEIRKHRLRREIVVTATTNSIINRMGPSFALRAAEESGSAVVDVARAYSIAREAFDARDAWAQLERLDGQLPSDVQYRIYGNIARGLRHATMWLLQQHGAALASGDLRVIDAVARYAPGIRQLRKSLPDLLSGVLARRYATEQATLIASGLPTDQARSLAAFPVLEWTLDVIDLAATRRIASEKVAHKWFTLPVELKFDWIEELIEEMPVQSTLHAAARRQLRGEAKRARRNLVEADLTGRTPATRQRDVWQSVLRDIQSTENPDHAVLSVCAGAMRELLDS